MAKKVTRRTEPFSYVLAADRTLPAAEQSRFRLRPANGLERAVARDSISVTVLRDDGERMIRTRTRQVALQLCLSNIDAVDNFPAGAAEPWPSDVDARTRYLEALDDEAINELGNEIFAPSPIAPSIEAIAAPVSTPSPEAQ